MSLIHATYYLTPHGNEYRLWRSPPTPEQVAGSETGENQVTSMCAELVAREFGVHAPRPLVLEVAVEDWKR